jgi:hypothetical protein
MASGGGRLDEKDENDRGKSGTKRKNNVIIIGIGRIIRKKRREEEKINRREKV